MIETPNCILRQKLTWVRAYIGSSEYDTKQMSNFIDDIINEMHNADRKRADFLKACAQARFIQTYPNEDFMAIFGRNYL